MVGHHTEYHTCKHEQDIGVEAASCILEDKENNVDNESRRLTLRR